MNLQPGSEPFMMIGCSQRAFGDLTTLGQLEYFLPGMQVMVFSCIHHKDACYRWIQGKRLKFRYRRLSSQESGVVIRYLMKISGHLRQQFTRLIARYRKKGRLQHRQRTVSGFQPKYNRRDIHLLASISVVICTSRENRVPRPGEVVTWRNSCQLIYPL